MSGEIIQHLFPGVTVDLGQVVFDAIVGAYPNRRAVMFKLMSISAEIRRWAFEWFSKTGGKSFSWHDYGGHLDRGLLYVRVDAMIVVSGRCDHLCWVHMTGIRGGVSRLAFRVLWSRGDCCPEIISASLSDHDRVVVAREDAFLACNDHDSGSDLVDDSGSDCDFADDLGSADTHMADENTFRIEYDWPNESSVSVVEAPVIEFRYPDDINEYNESLHYLLTPFGPLNELLDFPNYGVARDDLSQVPSPAFSKFLDIIRS